MLLIVLLSLLATSSADYCGAQTCCEDCVQLPSWGLGQSCRWCRVTNQCHAYLSMHNQCYGDEDIHRQVADWQQECQTPLRTRYRYDVKLSSKSLMASAAAYYKPSRCIRLLLPEADYRAVREFDVRCSLLHKSNCSGYLAVSPVDETILLAFRGSESWAQVTTQVFQSVLIPPKRFLAGQVESYFLTAFQLLWKEMSDPFQQLRSIHSTYRVLVTGHSLGGAIASIASLHLADSKMVNGEQLVLYTFGMPRVGDVLYALEHSKKVPNSMRVVNGHDPVAHYPPKFGSPPKCPTHHGLEVFYRNATSADNPWTECRGLPFNEDSACSWSHLKHRMDDHVNYFGLRVGAHCKQLLDQGHVCLAGANQVSECDTPLKYDIVNEELFLLH